MDNGKHKRRRLETDDDTNHSFRYMSARTDTHDQVQYQYQPQQLYRSPSTVAQALYEYDFTDFRQQGQYAGHNAWPGIPGRPATVNPATPGPVPQNACYGAYYETYSQSYERQAEPETQAQIGAQAKTGLVPVVPPSVHPPVLLDTFMDPRTDLANIPNANSEIVCFGRIMAISGRWEHRDIGRPPPTGRFAVKLQTERAFALPNGDGRACGRIQAEHSNVIYGLLEETAIELHVTCTVDDIATATTKTSSAASWPCQLDMTLYGPMSLTDELATWLKDNGIFLQDPLECRDAGRDAIYRNPQRLSTALDPASCILVSAFLLQQQQQRQQQYSSLALSSSHLQDLPPQPDVLEVLSNHIDLAEAVQPDAIWTGLQSHQKRALTFMLQRERGWSYDSTPPDLWHLVDTDTNRVFLNRISDSCQADEPPAFSGGIIADPMGLGKTLTMIALVTTDLDGYSKEAVRLRGGVENNEHEEEDEEEDEAEARKVPVPATLIVIPAPLIGSWEEQLSQHVDGRLQYLRHHGRTKITGIDKLNGINIVVTSYDTVAAEWKAARHPSVLFSVRWRRIILDEAHFIRNGSTNCSKAACALAAISRWAVTGTPIQNRLGDLAALLSFVRAHPYTDPKVFDADISRLWKAGEDGKAAHRLKLLSTYLILRRPKTAINLPPRHDLLYPVDLARDERTLYDDIHAQALTKIDEAMREDATERTRAGIYANALQKIESLRLVCDMGLHYHTRATAVATAGREEERRRKNGKSAQPSNSPSEEDAWTCSAQNVFNSQRDLGPMECMQCASTLELTETMLADECRALLTRCLKFICTDCAKKLRHLSSPPSSSSSSPSAQKMPRVACGHQPVCPTASVSTSSAIWEEIPDSLGLGIAAVASPLSPYFVQDFQMPTKIDALLADLRAQPPDTKCVIFSTWRLTLDIIQRGLDQIGVPSARFDGKVPQKERQSVIDRFRTDPSVRAMLLTFSCGAVGLTLTVATRAYLMEPHWNPTLEEQALARIHRLGQTKEVTTVRFYVRHSVEEHVMRLQESKKHLASVLLSHHDTGQVDDNLDGLHKLRSLL